jgi:hypothetical protein
MCRIFAKENIVLRAEAGELRMIVNSKPIDPPFVDYKRQSCVWTEDLLFVDDSYPTDHHRHEVARAHQFRLADGTIGASGRPDPKDIMIGDVNYRGLKQKNPVCELCEGVDMIDPAERFWGSTYRPSSGQL